MYAPPPRVFAPSIQLGQAAAGATLFVATREQLPPVSPDELAARQEETPTGMVSYQGPPEARPGLAAFTASFAVLGGLSLLLTRKPAPRAAKSFLTFGAAGVCEVRCVSLGFDWNARAHLQKELDAIASSFDFNTPAGLHAGAMRARTLMTAAVGNAMYAAFQSFTALAPRDAETKFAAMADKMRERYSVETVSNARRVAAPEVAPSAEEGRGLVVVTMITGTTVPLAPMPVSLMRSKIVEACQTLVPAAPTDLVALEVVWSPAVESDRMSSAELEVIYPELAIIDSSAKLGRKACSYCRAVHAAELPCCPACGARPE